MDSDRNMHAHTNHPPSSSSSPAAAPPPPPPPSAATNPNLYAVVELDNPNQDVDINYVPFYPPNNVYYDQAVGTHPGPYYPPPPPLYPTYEESEKELVRRARTACYIRLLLLYVLLCFLGLIFGLVLSGRSGPQLPAVSITRATANSFRPIASPGFFTPDIALEFSIRNPNNDSRIRYVNVDAAVLYLGEAVAGWTRQREMWSDDGEEFVRTLRVITVDMSLEKESMRRMRGEMESGGGGGGGGGVVEFDVKLLAELIFVDIKRERNLHVSCSGLKIAFVNGTAVEGQVKEAPKSCSINN